MIANRKSRAGITLITTLLFLLVLSTFAILISQTTFARAKVITRITSEHQVTLAIASVAARHHARIGESMLAAMTGEQGPVPLDGSEVVTTLHGVDLAVRMWDLSALPDLYRSPAADFNGAISESELARLRRELPRATLLDLEQAIAFLGKPHLDATIHRRSLRRARQGERVWMSIGQPHPEQIVVSSQP